MVSNRNRVIQILSDNEHITIAQLAQMIGKPPANLYDIQTGKIKGVSDKLADLILSVFPQYSKSWLVTGEGQMFRAAQSIGDISNSNVSGVNVSGTDIHINPNAYDALMKIVETYQASTAKFQEQIDRLLAIIEMKLQAEYK